MKKLPTISLSHRRRRTKALLRDEPTPLACLFLDVDGTLLEHAERPETVEVDPALIALLGSAFDFAGGAVALVSGRPITSLDALFAPLTLPVAGLHGLERRGADGRLHSPQIEIERLDAARALLRGFLEGHPEVRLEDKRSSLALHYRGASHAKADVEAIMSVICDPLLPEFTLLAGSDVLEVKPASHTKATAVEAFLSEAPFRGRRPIYLGDDVTDLSGFDAVRRHGGIDIAVGGRVTARWTLSGPAAVHEWLASLLPQEVLVA